MVENKVNDIPEIKRKGNGQFAKGQSGNVTGRSLGAKNYITHRYLAVKEEAANQYPNVFRILCQKALEGEGWAQTLFWKEFVSKEDRKLSVVVKSEDPSIKGQIEALTKAIGSFEEVTYDEALERLKTLAAVKGNELQEEQTEVMRESREAIEAKLDKVEKVIEMKLANNIQEERI